MDDKRLNDLLRWSIENSESSRNDETAAPPQTQLTPEMLSAIQGGPSDADLMRASMDIITSPDSEVSLDNKLIAFDNFEQLIEGLDNANNMANLNLWSPLLEQLQHPENEIRKMASWCIGTAVQNNVKTQERMLAAGGVKPLVELAVGTEHPEAVRRKAIYALSSACRNYQPALDATVEHLVAAGHHTETCDATDMEQVDKIINDLREKAKAA